MNHEWREFNRLNHLLRRFDDVNFLGENINALKRREEILQTIKRIGIEVNTDETRNKNQRHRESQYK